MTTTKNNEHKKLNFSSEREQSQACLNSAEHEKNQGRKVLNVPNLRFPEFQGEWEKCILGDITENFNLRNKDKIQYPMFSVTNDRGFVPQSEQFEGRDMVGEDIKAYKIIHTNDFAYNPARINVGSIAIYTGEKPCMISSLYVCFKTTKEVNNEWLMQLLKTPKMNYYYNVNGEGGVRVYLFYPNFARIRMSIPKIEEQKKIAKLLNLLDERIATQNKIIDKLQSLIKGIRNDVFGKLRKNIGFNAVVGDVLDYEQPQSYIVEDTEYTNEGTPVLTANKAFVLGYTLETDGIYDNGDCIIFDDFTLDCKYVDFPFKVKSSAIKILTAKNKELLRYTFEFLKYLDLSTEEHKRHYIAETQNQEIILPTEQMVKTIAHIFSTLSLRMETAVKQRNVFETQKQYLLRQMFI